ncbi:MAG: beta-galactosidase [Thermoleophilaceae bacterium]|nr:beta-galactosidase [Thermoleophilaceae bacterium]
MALIAAVALLAIAATPAMAAKRKVPFGFFGTVYNVEADHAASTAAAKDAQMALMARSGVESLRVFFAWPAIEPRQGTYNWTRMDDTVAAAARHRISILANVLSTAEWASLRPNSTYPTRFPPRDPALYAQFVNTLVQRYGPKGTFWTANPSIPKVPIRQWQIWNEQMAPWFWDSRPWARSYVKMLKVTYRTIHKADRGAKVVAGSFVGVGDYTQWEGIRDLYKAGAKGYFDTIAVHPFTNDPKSARNSVSRMLEIVQRVRAVMKKRHDVKRKSIILTELTWPAAVGKLPKRRLLGLETTTKGQRLRMIEAYRRLSKVRRKMRITNAYWFAWATPYDDNSPQSDVSYRYTGLARVSPEGVFSRMPLLGTFTSLAKKYQGCRKSADARRCR